MHQCTKENRQHNQKRKSIVIGMIVNHCIMNPQQVRNNWESDRKIRIKQKTRCAATATHNIITTIIRLHLRKKDILVGIRVIKETALL
jgi:hypothetical protein